MHMGLNWRSEAQGAVEGCLTIRLLSKVTSSHRTGARDDVGIGPQSTAIRQPYSSTLQDPFPARRWRWVDRCTGTPDLQNGMGSVIHGHTVHSTEKYITCIHRSAQAIETERCLTRDRIPAGSPVEGLLQVVQGGSRAGQTLGDECLTRAATCQMTILRHAAFNEEQYATRTPDLRASRTRQPILMASLSASLDTGRLTFCVSVTSSVSATRSSTAVLQTTGRHPLPLQGRAVAVR